jgi:hypothetical protein
VNANRTAQFALVLSAVTLAVVLLIAARPVPEPLDNTPAVLHDIATLQQSIVDLRTMVEAGAGESAAGDIVVRLDRLEAAVAGVGAKLDSICAAIQASPFAPSGFACP